MLILASALAGVLAIQPCPACRKRPHPSSAQASLGPSLLQERALRRRVIRLARIKMFERREAMLFSFLAQAHTEEPVLDDPRVVDVGAGILVGPTTITLDFLGSPIVRAQVRNTSAARASPLLTVSMRGQAGGILRASTVMEPLEPGGSRVIELLSPSRGRPASVTWSAMR